MCVNCQFSLVLIIFLHVCISRHERLQAITKWLQENRDKSFSELVEIVSQYLLSVVEIICLLS